MGDSILPNSPQSKQCNKCKQYFPQNATFFCRDKNKKDGLCTICKECKNSARRLPQVEKEPVPEGMKQCFKCKDIFPATTEFFHKNNQKKDGLHPLCKTCKSDHIRVYNATEKARLSRRLYAQQNRKEISEKARIYRNIHKDVINEQQRERLKKPRAQMVKRAAHIRRRARKRAVAGNLTSEQIQQKLKAQRYRCYYAACGHSKFEKKNGKYIYHLEHTIPLSRTEYNPKNDVNYVVLSCPACNMSKSDKLPGEWAEGGRLF